MAADDEIGQLWDSFPEKMKQTPEAIIRFYRLAENAGNQAGILAVEKELLSDATVKEAINVFGWGGNMKASLITQKAILREAVRLAVDKVRK